MFCQHHSLFILLLCSFIMNAAKVVNKLQITNSFVHYLHAFIKNEHIFKSELLYKNNQKEITYGTIQ